MEIDFIIYWVDGSDEEWQKKKAIYMGTEYQNNAARYRDWDILRYWFRAVDQYAPWVHRIYFVADNQRPSWLNFEHPKLEYVDHQDFIPYEYLPTFQANTIELNFHRIKGLSEHFIVFNDDMYINAPVSPEYYFKDGLPCDAPYEHLFTGCGFDRIDKWGINIIDYVNTQIINANFNRSDVVNNNKKGWYGGYLGRKYQLQAYLLKWFKRSEFQHFYTPHNEKAFLKSIYVEAWEKEPELLGESCTRFRENLNLSCYFIRYWQLAKNMFYPQDVLKTRTTCQLQNGCLQELESKLFNPKIKSLCTNDTSSCTYEDFITLKPKVIELFERKYPKKSSYEL